MPGPPGGRLARLSRERAQPGAMVALGDGCFRATAVLPHHAAGCGPIQLVGLIVEHLTSMCCGPQHIDVGFFVSQAVSLQRRMKWVGGVRADDGKIYAIPCDAHHVLQIDPHARSVTLIDFGVDLSIWGYGKFYGGVLVNGKIYAIPCDARRVLEFRSYTVAMERRLVNFPDVSG